MGRQSLVLLARGVRTPSSLLWMARIVGVRRRGRTRSCSSCCPSAPPRRDARLRARRVRGVEGLAPPCAGAPAVLAGWPPRARRPAALAPAHLKHAALEAKTTPHPFGHCQSPSRAPPPPRPPPPLLRLRPSRPCPRVEDIRTSLPRSVKLGSRVSPGLIARCRLARDLVRCTAGRQATAVQQRNDVARPTQARDARQNSSIDESTRKTGLCVRSLYFVKCANKLPPSRLLTFQGTLARSEGRQPLRRRTPHRASASRRPPGHPPPSPPRPPRPLPPPSRSTRRKSTPTNMSNLWTSTAPPRRHPRPAAGCGGKRGSRRLRILSPALFATTASSSGVKNFACSCARRAGPTPRALRGRIASA